MRNACRQPMVSVVIPCYNAEKYVCEAVFSALRQTYSNLEVIIVDDGSTDRSWNILVSKFSSEENVKLLSHPGRSNLGVSKTRRVGIEAACGAYIAFLDADDVFEPNKIELQMDIFRKHPSVVLVHGAATILIDGKIPEVSEATFKTFSTSKLYTLMDRPYLQHNSICNSTVMVRTGALATIPNSFQQVFQYEDWVNWILLGTAGSFFYLDVPLSQYRYHSGSSTFDLVNNDLKPIYAKLEMLFVLMTRVADKRVKQKVFDEIQMQVRKGILQYSDTRRPFSFYLFYLRHFLKIVFRRFSFS